MKKFLCSLLILSFWALYGMAQYGPGEGGYGGVSLRFLGRLLTQGTCYQPAENILRCQIPEGSPGVLELVAERTPVGPVNVRLVSAPAGWPSFPVTSGWGTVRAQYRFTIPPGTAGSQFELLFEAWTAGIPYPLQLQVILEVVSVQPPTEPEYPPPGYVTDSQGGFSVPVEEFPDTVVSGTLTRCGIQPLPGVPVSVELIPKEGRQWIRNLGDIGAVRVSSPGYGEAVVSEFRLLSSMDITGRVQRTIDVGIVCLKPPVTESVPPEAMPDRGSTSGTTDEEGKFSVPLPGQPGATVTGRLTECTIRPLPNQEFVLTPVYEGNTLSGFTVAVPGYEPVTVTEFGRVSIFGLTTYLLGNVCLQPVEEEEAAPTCTLIVRGRVADSSHDYPVSYSKVWLFVLRDGDALPLPPLSIWDRRPDAVTRTNHTAERTFNGREFVPSEKATYEFRLQWTGPCPPRVVVVSLLWYDNRDLMAVSSENQVGGRFVPVYLARLITGPDDPWRARVGSAAAVWRRTGPNEYTADPVDFFYGDLPPLARDSARVIGAGGVTSENWDRKGADPDAFMNSCAHFYFWSYKAMRYLEELAEQLGVTLKPVLVSMFSLGATRCSSADVQFGDLAGGTGPRVTADAHVLMNEENNLPPWGGNKPDNNIWHELGHYWWLQIYGGFLPGAPPPDNNHGGWRNGSTTDSLQEGFAEFTSMLVCEYYGDRDPQLYRWSGHDDNLEVDIPAWGRPGMPDDEEFAVAGLLWDLHDGRGIERKPKGTISTVIETRDHVSLSDVQVFEIFVNTKPRTVKAMHDALVNYPAYGLSSTDIDWDGVLDVSELFVAHGFFDDIGRNGLGDPAKRTSNRLWDGGEERIGFSGGRAPDGAIRVGRQDRPPIPQAYLLIRILGPAGEEIDVTRAVMHIEIDFPAEFSYYDYSWSRELESKYVYFLMPPDIYSPVARITVEVPGLGRSEPLVITTDRYWQLLQEARNAGLSFFLDHVFAIKPQQ